MTARETHRGHPRDRDPEQKASRWNRGLEQGGVGGLLHKIGRLQFEFLLRRGLRGHDAGAASPGLQHSSGNVLLHGIHRKRQGSTAIFGIRLVELGIEEELGQAVFLRTKTGVHFLRGFRVPSVFQDTRLLDCPVPPDSPGPFGHSHLPQKPQGIVKDGHVAFATSSKGILHATARSPILTFASITPWRKWMPSAGTSAGSRLTSVIGTIPKPNDDAFRSNIGPEFMKIGGVTRPALPEVTASRFACFRDHRGFSTERCRASEIEMSW